MTENEHLDKIKQLAAKKKLPILDETEFLTFQLDKSDELEIDEDDIVAYIPITFDANKAFGLDVCQDTSNDNIYLTAEWIMGDASTLDLDIEYDNNSTLDGDFHLRVPLDERQQKLILARLEEQCRTVYGKPLTDIVKEKNWQEKGLMSKDEFWEIIDKVRAKVSVQDGRSVAEGLYKELIRLPQKNILAFDCIWQDYKDEAANTKLYAAACIINGGCSDDRFSDFRDWLIMQGKSTYQQAMVAPDSLAALTIPFNDAEWMICPRIMGNAFAGQVLQSYFQMEGIAQSLQRKYPELLQAPGALNEQIMLELLIPYRLPDADWERQMLRTEVKHYIKQSNLEYSYGEFYSENVPKPVTKAKTLADLPQIDPNQLARNIADTLPELLAKRQAWDAEQIRCPRYHGEER